MKTNTFIIQKSRVALMLLMITAFFNQAFAQAHNVKCASCKYWQRPADAKNVVNTGCVCEACREKDTKEREAKQAEDKRRNDILVAKQKKEAAERERISKENKAREEAEKKRKEENIARTKKEYEDAIRRAGEIRSKYKQLNNIKGDEYEEEIVGLEAYSDKEYFGVKLNGDFLWRKPTDNLPISMRKIDDTNYFIASNGSKEKIYDLYGKPILIDGEEWFDYVFFDKERRIFEFKIFYGKEQRISDQALSCKAGRASIGFESIYNSISEIITIHEENYKIDQICWEEYRAKNPGSGSVLTMSRRAYATHGLYIVSDLKFKVLKHQIGYFASLGH